MISITFLETFILFMSILYCVKEAFKLYKSVLNRNEFLAKKGELTVLALSISYILSYIIIL
jgi:hypothetical protein